ncbi:hypothetical protein ScPMuIL_014271 [Solemya velum]
MLRRLQTPKTSIEKVIAISNFDTELEELSSKESAIDNNIAKTGFEGSQGGAKARESVSMDVSMSLLEGVDALPASPDCTGHI